MSKQADIAKTDWYTLLIDDCKGIITEYVFQSRWALIEGYWSIGERITVDSDYQKYAQTTDNTLQDLAKDIGVSLRTLYYALKVYEKYPNMDKIPDGKNISWNKLITKYLTEKKNDKQDVKHECPLCGSIHTILP